MVLFSSIFHEIRSDGACHSIPLLDCLEIKQKRPVCKKTEACRGGVPIGVNEALLYYSFLQLGYWVELYGYVHETFGFYNGYLLP